MTAPIVQTQLGIIETQIGEYKTMLADMVLEIRDHNTRINTMEAARAQKFLELAATIADLRSMTGEHVNLAGLGLTELEVVS